MRLTHRTPANPVRRNTTRGHHRNMHARSQPNMRQISAFGSQIDSLSGSTKQHKSIERDATVTSIPKVCVSQSAPHTPIAYPNIECNSGKSVPRGLSEPIVTSRTKHASIKFKHIETSPRVLRTPASPKGINKKESKFFLRSPLAKRDNSFKFDRFNKKSDGTDV